MIEPFTNRIPMWIVRHGHRLLDVIHGVQMGDDIIFKASALVTVIADWNPIDTKQFADYDLSDGKCLLVVGNKDLTEFSKGISWYCCKHNIIVRSIQLAHPP